MKQLVNIIRQYLNRDKTEWFPLGIVIFTAIIFLLALQNGFVGDWDDNYYIHRNPYIKDFTFENIRAIFTEFFMYMYHPLTIFSYLVEYTLFKLNPLPYHLTNVIFHLGSTYLVYLLAVKLSSQKTTGIVVSLLFAVHPMHVESVVWISQRKDVLYAFFYIFSLLVYVNYLDNASKKRLYFYSLMLFIASLLSKPAAVSLPVLLVAIDIYKERRFQKKSIIEKIPFFMLSLLFGILELMSQKPGGAFEDMGIMYTLFERVVMFFYVIAFYFTKLIFPFQLSALYSYPQVNDAMLSWYYFASFPFLLIVFWILYKWRSMRKEILFGVSFFFISIALMLQILPNCIALTCDRYTYVSYIGFFYIIGQYIANINTRIKKQIVWSLFFFVVLSFSFLTINRIKVWENDETLFSDVLKKFPNDYNAHYFMGVVKRNKGDKEGSLQYFDRCIQLNKYHAEAYCNRGALYYEIDRKQLAFADFNLSIQLNPDLSIAYSNRGWAYFEADRFADAEADLNKAVFLDSKNAKAFQNRCIIRLYSGNITGALKDIISVTEIDKENADNYYLQSYVYSLSKRTNEEKSSYKKATTLGVASYSILRTISNLKKHFGDFNGALHYNSEASKQAPNDISLFLERWDIFMKMGNYDEALRCVNRALQIDSTNAMSYNNRGNLYSEMNDFVSALNDYSNAVKYNPELASAYNNRSILLVNIGDFEKAMKDISIAILLEPSNPDYYCTRGFVKTQVNSLEEAITDFDKAIQLHANLGKAYFYRGIAYIAKKDFQNVCKDMTKANELGFPQAYEYLLRYCNTE